MVLFWGTDLQWFFFCSTYRSFLKHLYRITFSFKIYIFPSLWYSNLILQNSSIHSLFSAGSRLQWRNEMYNVFLEIRSRLCFGYVWEKNKSAVLIQSHLVLPYTRDAVWWRFRLHWRTLKSVYSITLCWYRLESPPQILNSSFSCPVDLISQVTERRIWFQHLFISLICCFGAVMDR